MTTHAAILEQLEKYEDGRFVPRDWGGATLQYTNCFRWGMKGVGYISENSDAHAYIERAAFRAVMHWCGSSGEHMMIGDFANEHGHACHVRRESGHIASGLDEPAMWLAAMKYINGEKA